ncbi:hypothetical protein LCGC14_2858750 [marine sediment metagenome]|uniref:Uncharacterized protein n=1 Tax=marine sediment metagenome TaxID=412755 RepID=A0A0F9AEQ5_9ZZZZ
MGLEKMTVGELIARLMRFNQSAKVDVVVHCMPEQFTITWGGREGDTKKTCSEVSFYVDRLCQDESDC